MPNGLKGDDDEAQNREHTNKRTTQRHKTAS